MASGSSVQALEYGILGGMLRTPECVGEVVAALTPEDFSEGVARVLFETVSALHFAGEPVDAVTVLRKTGDDGYGLAIRDALDQYAVPANILYYCQLLRQTQQLSEIQGEAYLTAAAQTLDEAAEHIARLNGLLSARRSAEVLSAADAAMDFCTRQDAPPPAYLSFGLGKLDKALYAELGDFIVVGGYASSGKTLLSIQFAVALAKRYRVGYFSLETGPRKLTDRLMAYLAQVPLARIKDRTLSGEDWEALAKAASDLSALPLDFIDAGGMTVRDIQALALQRRYEVVLVDYLQLISDRGGSRYEQVTHISQDLHTMARTNHMTVIALAQLRRADKVNGKPKPPTMADFRESGQIEQDADVALLLYPSDPNDNNSDRILKVGKNKEGERLKLTLSFDGAKQTLREAPVPSWEQRREAHKAIREAGRSGPRQTVLEEVTGEIPGLPF